MIRRTLKKVVRTLGYDLTRFGPGSDSLNELSALLSRVARPVVFDVGAHHGQTARTFAAAFPHAELYCFEPFPDSFAELERNSQSYPRARLEPLGFADSSGRQEFYCNESSPTNSLLQLDSRAATVWGNSGLSPTRRVACDFDTLDSYLDRNDIKCVDLLKLDVQGAEYKVLQGAERAMRANRIRNVYLEIIIGETYVGQHSLGDYLNLFDSLGFRVQGLFNFEHGEERQLIQLDGLFSRRQGLAQP